jgi:hypothetical protein
MTTTESELGPSLRAYIANCLIGGDEITQNESSWIRDLVIFNIAGATIRLRQKPDVIHGPLSTLTDRLIETSEATIEHIVPEGVAEAKAMIERLCWLLSFAGTCRVIPYGYEYPANSGLKQVQSVSGVARHFRPAFEIRDGSLVKSFVEQTYQRYSELESERKLRVIFDYLAQAEAPGQLMEVRSILSFVALENLKHTFAHSKNIVYADGAFRKPSWTPGQRGHKYSFKELVALMLDEVGMPHQLDAAYSLRNDLIHSGLTALPFPEQRALYEDVHDLIREYLLRLLGYKGRYSPYAFERRGISAEIQ